MKNRNVSKPKQQKVVASQNTSDQANVEVNTSKKAK